MFGIQIKVGVITFTSRDRFFINSINETIPHFSGKDTGNSMKIEDQTRAIKYKETRRYASIRAAVMMQIMSV